MTTRANDGPGNVVRLLLKQMSKLVTLGNASSSREHHQLQETWNNPSHEDIRAVAAIHARLRAESFQKAAAARSNKQGELAMFYAQQVID